MRALGAKGTEVFSAKLTIWKQLATTFQYLGNSAQPAPRWLFHYIITICVAQVLGRVLVPRMLDGPQMYATWLGCSNRAVFCSVSLVAFWQKRSRDQPETAPERGTDQQNQRSTAELEQHSTAGRVCLRGNLPNICLFVEAKVESSTSK